MPYSVSRGVKTHYEVSGEGPAMVLIHANPFDHTLFLYQIHYFSALFTVVSPDLRGYGRSDIVTSRFTLGDLADDVYGVCRQEGITEEIVVGVSTGSGIALLLGLDRPEDLAQPTARMQGYLEKGLDGYHLEHLEDLVSSDFAESELGGFLLRSYVDRGRVLGWKADGIVEVLRARRGLDMTSRLGEMRVPTLVINGEFDSGMPSGTRTAALVPGAVHKILPGVGHACCLEDPGTFNTVVADFLGDNGLLPGD